MPITYHYRARSPDSVDDLLASPQQESFQDDSIVLSDLIRTGETSRLRRRGAMRIEPTGTSTSRHRLRSSVAPRSSDDTINAESPGYSWTIVENRSRRIPRHLPMLEVSDDDFELEDSDSDSGDEMVFSASFNRAISEQTGHPITNELGSLRTRSSMESEGSEKSTVESTSYSLVCGGPVDDMAICARSDPESVYYSALASFILPQHPQSSSSSRRTSSGISDTNGCGVVIHTRAFPRYRHHQPMWTASTPATEEVVPLERMYFDDICAKEKLSPKMIKQEACGCLRIGIGCANWYVTASLHLYIPLIMTYSGNPLGFRLTPCRTLQDSISTRRSHLRQSTSASGSKSGSDDSKLHLYTFFCSSTTSPQTSTFPIPESSSRRRRDPSRPRTYPLLPPPPPLIRLMSDSEMSDTDEEVIIDFRAPDSSSIPSRILGGDITASPEPTSTRLEPNPSPFIPSRNQDDARAGSAEEETELGRAMASWANVARGIEATASSLGEDMDNSPSLSSPRFSIRRPRGPERRDALGFDAEEELGLRLVDTSQPQGASSSPSSSTDIPSILFEEATVALTPPTPETQELPSSTLEPDDVDQTTPRATAWGMSFADGHPLTSFWGRPGSSSDQWTWSNELAEAERERERGDRPARVFDPDGEFLEGLDGEWGEDMARQLGFGSLEEKNDGSETPTTGLWWP